MKYFILAMLLIPTLCFADSEEVKVQVNYKISTPQGVYSDALYFTPDEYAKADPKTIEATKQLRAARWIESVKNAPVRIETKEMVKQDITLLENELAKRKEKLTTFEAKID